MPADIACEKVNFAGISVFFDSHKQKLKNANPKQHVLKIRSAIRNLVL